MRDEDVRTLVFKGRVRVLGKVFASKGLENAVDLLGFTRESEGEEEGAQCSVERHSRKVHLLQEALKHFDTQLFPVAITRFFFFCGSEKKENDDERRKG